MLTHKGRSLNTIVSRHYNVDSHVICVNHVKRQRNMLILTRRPEETLIIGGHISVTVLDVKGGRVRIGVDAPRDIIVKRQELFEKSGNGHRLTDAGP